MNSQLQRVNDIKQKRAQNRVSGAQTGRRQRDTFDIFDIASGLLTRGGTWENEVSCQQTSQPTVQHHITSIPMSHKMVTFPMMCVVYFNSFWSISSEQNQRKNKKKVNKKSKNPSWSADKVELTLSGVEMAMNVQLQHSEQCTSIRTHTCIGHCLPHRHGWMQHKVHASVRFFIWRVRVVTHWERTD